MIGGSDRGYNAIAKPTSLIRIKAPQQMGKTSFSVLTRDRVMRLVLGKATLSRSKGIAQGERWTKSYQDYRLMPARS